MKWSRVIDFDRLAFYACEDGYHLTILRRLDGTWRYGIWRGNSPTPLVDQNVVRSTLPGMKMITAAAYRRLRRVGKEPL